jgi:ferredoxin
MKRKIIKIDEEKCNGCGLCMPGCPEGALQMIDGKARLVSDLFCDGLGACIGQCPEGAITIEEREAVAYDERQVIAGIAKQGKAVVEAHLQHLRDHNQMEYLQQALAYLREKGLIATKDAAASPMHSHAGGGCPGSRAMSFAPAAEDPTPRPAGNLPSRLTHWPIQLHLISPQAPHFQGADLLLAADCVAFSLGGFHEDYLKGKTLAIACPKLDNGQEIYVEKLVSLIDHAQVKSLTVMIMQVPCCGGLLQMARSASAQAERQLPIDYIVVGLRGEILQQGRV